MSNIAIITDDEPLFQIPLHVTTFRVPPRHIVNYDIFGKLNHRLIFLNRNWFKCVMHALQLPGINFVQPFQRVHYVDVTGTLVDTQLGQVQAEILGASAAPVMDNWFMRSQYFHIKPSAEYGWSTIPGDVICMI